MTIWVTIYKVAGAALAVLIIVALICMFLPQYQKYRRYQAREAALQDEIRLERDMIRTLRRKQEQFRTDPQFVERVAHEIGLAREGETLYKFIDDAPSTQPGGP